MHELLKDRSVIFFDVGYTIDRPTSGDWLFTNKFYEIAGDRLKQCEEAQISMARQAGADYLDKEHHILTEEEEAKQFFQYYRIVSENLQLGLTEAELTAIAEDRTYNMANYTIYPDAKKVIETLSKTHRLGLISDTWPSIENQLSALGVFQYFSFATYSFALGTFKPDKRMYLDALQKCGCDARDTVFIDDCPQNLEAAAELGITPILIATNPAADVDVPYTKTRSLSELI